MTVKEGKNFLRDCLLELNPTADIDSLICYKYSNRQDISNYQRDDITVNLREKDFETLERGALFVVTCFIHAEMYVAWPQSIGRGNGKFIIYKRELVEINNSSNCDFKAVLIGSAKDAHAYIFRGKQGILKFYRNIIFPQLSSYKY